MSLLRLRRSAGEDSSLPLHMDEQEQEEVIQALHASDAHTDDLFKKSFAFLSLFSSIVFILLPSHISLLAITSLALTAYTAYFLPLKQGLLPSNSDDGPLRYIPVLNGALSAVVVLDALVSRKDTEVFWIATIPVIMWSSLWVARRWASGVDIQGLANLKYNVPHLPSSPVSEK